MIFIDCFPFVLAILPSMPDPDRDTVWIVDPWTPLNPDPIRIRIRIHNTANGKIRYWFPGQENHFIFSGQGSRTLKNWSLSLNGVSSVETTSPLAAGRAGSVTSGFGARSGGGGGNLRPRVGGRWRVDTSWLERISSDSGLYLAARRLALSTAADGILSAPPLTCAAVRISLMAGRPSCKV